MKHTLKILALAAVLATTYSCKINYHYENREGTTIKVTLNKESTIFNKGFQRPDSIITTYNPESGVKFKFQKQYTHSKENPYRIRSMWISYEGKSFKYCRIEDDNSKLTTTVNKAWFAITEEMRNSEPEKRVREKSKNNYKNIFDELERLVPK